MTDGSDMRKVLACGEMKLTEKAMVADEPPAEVAFPLVSQREKRQNKRLKRRAKRKQRKLRDEMRQAQDADDSSESKAWGSRGGGGAGGGRRAVEDRTARTAEGALSAEGSASRPPAESDVESSEASESEESSEDEETAAGSAVGSAVSHEEQGSTVCTEAASEHSEAAPLVAHKARPAPQRYAGAGARYGLGAARYGLGAARSASAVVKGVDMVRRRVMVKGLNSRPELNGLRGRVESYDSLNERYHVRLDQGKKTMAFKFGNVQLI